MALAASEAISALYRLDGTSSALLDAYVEDFGSTPESIAALWDARRRAFEQTGRTATSAAFHCAVRPTV